MIRKAIIVVLTLGASDFCTDRILGGTANGPMAHGNLRFQK